MSFEGDRYTLCGYRVDVGCWEVEVAAVVEAPVIEAAVVSSVAWMMTVRVEVLLRADGDAVVVGAPAARESGRAARTAVLSLAEED